MRLDIRNQQNLMQRLRYIAEKHPDDVTANYASDLAHRMEAMKNVVDTSTWSEIDQRIVDYAVTI